MRSSLSKDSFLKKHWFLVFLTQFQAEKEVRIVQDSSSNEENGRYKMDYMLREKENGEKVATSISSVNETNILITKFTD